MDPQCLSGDEPENLTQTVSFLALDSVVVQKRVSAEPIRVDAGRKTTGNTVVDSAKLGRFMLSMTF